jgi:hypothetical protein
MVTACAAACCNSQLCLQLSWCTQHPSSSQHPGEAEHHAVVCLSCRQKVLEWLGQLGALDLAEDHEVTLPQLAPHQWQQLHSNSPMLMKPKLDRSVRPWGPKGCC